MTAATAPSAHASSPENLQATAASLWTFVHLKVPRFTSEVALEIVKRLRPQPGDDPKALAKRLRALLSESGVSLKHTAALDAAARMLGHSSWHACDRETPKVTLKLSGMAQAPEELFADWHALAPRLCEWCTAWHTAKGAKVFEAQWNPEYVLISIALPKEGGTAGETERWPILAINPVGDSKLWLQEAPAAFEMLRRHLEESGIAVLDGVAVLQVCGRDGKEVLTPLDRIPQPVTPTDACDSELVLFREDNELSPGEGFEIARGDEMTCWSQLELALKDNPMEVVLDEAAWRIGDGRYVWQLNTLHPGDYIPGQVHTMLNEAEAEKLLRRYRLAKRIFGGRVKHHLVTKRLRYLSGPTDTYRVDLHRVFQALHDAGMDWDSFCEAEGLDQPKTPEVQVGFVMTLAEKLKLKDPNRLFAVPPRPQLELAKDDALLRSLLPRVDFVRYRLTRDVTPEDKEVVRDAIEDFSASLRVQKLQAAGQLVDPNDPLPYLVYAGDGEELRLKLESVGLEMYVGVMPHLISTEGVVEKLPNMWSYAFGHALYLDIDRMEGEQ